MNKSIAFQDESFSAQKAIRYHVNFYVALNGIVYSVFDTVDRKIVVIKSYENIELNSNDGIFLLLRKIYAEQGFIRLAMKISLITENAVLYLFPAELFDEEMSKQSIQEIHQTDTSKQEFFSDTCERFRIKTLNFTEAGFSKYLQQFQISQCKTLQTALLQHIPVSQTIAHQLYLYIGFDALYFFYFKNGVLQFSNSFKYSANEDVLFYTLFIYNNFDLDPDQVPLITGGSIMPEDNLYLLLYKYIRHIKTWELPQTDIYGQLLPDMRSGKIIPSIYSFV